MALLGLSVLALLVLGVPVAFAIGASTLLFFLSNAGTYPTEILSQQLVNGINSFPFLAVPFFILAGTLMSEAGMTRRLIEFASALVGSLTGALAQVVVVVAAMFGGMSGSATADAAFEAKALVPAMSARGYPLGFSAALVASASVITPLIPPSVGFVIYGYVSNTSVGRLLLAGIVPGLVTMVALMAMVSFTARRRGLDPGGLHPFDWAEVARAGRRAIWALLLPLILVGGIGLGVYTPTEAAGVAAAYSLIVGLFISREIKLARLWRVFAEAARDTATVSLILAVATPFSWALTVERIPHQSAEFMASLTGNPVVMLLIINLFLLVAGTIVDPGPLMIIVVPILMPTIRQMGIDPVHFGVVVLFNTLLGAISPPEGSILFAVLATVKISMAELTRWLLPQFAVLLGLLLLFTFVPELSLWLPNLVMGTSP